MQNLRLLTNEHIFKFLNGQGYINHFKKIMSILGENYLKADSSRPV